MKSQDLRTAVKNKYENGDGPAKIFCDLGGVVSKRTINSWIRMLKTTGSVNLSYSSGRPRSVRTKVNISEVKRRLTQKRRVPTRK